MTDALYSDAYYASDVEVPAAQAAPIMAKSIIDTFKPQVVVDVGCGTGALIEALHRATLRCIAIGLERSWSAIMRCEARGVSVRWFDIEKADVESAESRPGTRFDVAVSLEVAEHLPESAADRYVRLLTQLSDVIVFSAAPPGQGGVGHINEQPKSYWIEKFRDHRYLFDFGTTADWQREWHDSGVAWWYWKNLMILKATP